MRNLCLITTMAVLLSLSPPAAVLHSQEWGVISDTEKQFTPPTEYADASAIILFDQSNVTWNAAGLQEERHIRYKAFTPEAGKDIGDIVVRIARYDQIWRTRMQVIHSDGSANILDESHIVIAEEGPFTTATLHFGALRPGDIAELNYKIEHYGGVDKLGPEVLLLLTATMRGSLLHGQLRERQSKELDSREEYGVRVLPTWYFDHHLYTCRSILRMELDSEADHVFAPMNMSDRECLPREDSGWRLLKRYTWELQNLKPVPACDDPHCFNARRRSLHFGMLNSSNGGNHLTQATFENEYWSTIGLGIRGFLKEYCDRTGAMKKTVRNITNSAANNRALIDSLFRYVADNFRPASPALSLQPMNYNLKGLLKTRTGAGFEINLLLCELLNIAGIPAWPVFISTADRPSYRDLGRFNHALVYCEMGDEKLFLDACFPGCPPGTLPFVSRASGGLLVGQERLGACSIGASPCDNPTPAQPKATGVVGP